MSEVEIGSKRTGERDEYGEISSFKKPRSRGHDDNDDGREKMRFLILGRYSGKIIGKGGEYIKRLRSEYGCNIKVEDTKSEGVVTITGDREACVGVLREIIPYIPEPPYPVSPKAKCAFELNFLVQSDRVGSIIGKGGQRIKEIRDECSGKVTVYQDRLPDSNERIVAIGGDDESCVLAALDIILKTLDDCPLRKDTIYYDPRNSEGGGHQGQRQRDGGGANDRMMATDLPGNSNMAAAGLGGLGGLGTIGGLNAAAVLEQLGLGGLGGGLGGGVGGIAAGGGNMMANDGGRQRDADRDRRGNDRRDGRERGGRRDRDERRDQQQNGSNYDEQICNFGDMETETKITVPNEMIGAIIGKGGQRIKEIRHTSGAHVETTGSEKGSDEKRVVTIKGTQRQIVIAQQMMAECVQHRT